MKKYIAALLATATIFTFGTKQAEAAPVSVLLTLTTDSGIDLFISTIGGAVSAIVEFEITGTMGVGFDDGVPASTTISLESAEIDLSDETISLPLGFLGDVEGELTGLGINVLDSNGGIALTNTSGGLDPFTSTFDPGAGSPTDFVIDEGLFTYLGTGAIGGLLGSGTVDFASSPVSSTIGSIGQIGLVTQDVTIGGGSTVVNVIVSVPITFADTILTDPLVVDLEISGAFVATGSYTIIPEPSTMVLLGIAFVGLVPLWRRIRK